MLPATVGYFLGILAVLVLLAAGFNYVNLSTARSLTRAREVGVRKTVGARRRQVMGQFVAEGMIVAVLALGLAVILLQGLVPLYNQLSIHQQLAAQIDVRQGPLVYGGFLAFAVVVGALAGLYPAWHLSKFQPARVLKASARSETPGFGWMTSRKVLTVLQYTIAIVVLVTATLVYQQVQHMGRLDDVGVRTDRVARVALQDAPMVPFRQGARAVPGVEQVGAVRNLPLTGRTTSATLRSDRTADPLSSVYYPADYEALRILELSLTTADDWSAARYEGGQVIVANEAAALSALSSTWQQFDTVNPPAVERYDTLVRSRFVTPVAEAGGVLALVAALAALIGMLGLLGIATYTVQTRTREIGIRKALGTTVTSVVGLLSREFLWLVGTALAISLPLTWWLNQL